MNNTTNDITGELLDEALTWVSDVLDSAAPKETNTATKHPILVAAFMLTAQQEEMIDMLRQIRDGVESQREAISLLYNIVDALGDLTYAIRRTAD